MAEIKLRRKIIYSGEVFASLVDRGWSMTEAGNFLRNIREADAVEVVRCKDCKQWGGVAFGNVCRRWSAPLAGMKNCTRPDDFCSYGERRTDV